MAAAGTGLDLAASPLLGKANGAFDRGLRHGNPCARAAPTEGHAKPRAARKSKTDGPGDGAPGCLEQRREANGLGGGRRGTRAAGERGANRTGGQGELPDGPVGAAPAGHAEDIPSTTAWGRSVAAAGPRRIALWGDKAPQG